MLDTLRRKFTPILLAFMAGAISLVMLLTDFAPNMGGGSTTGQVAKVNGKIISFSEFNNAFQQRLQMFKGFTGKDLSEKEIQQFGIRRNTLNSLIQRQLIIQGGEKLGLKVSPSELRDRIWDMLKDQPYFKKNDTAKFDALTYKQVIQSTPYKSVSNFEKAVRSDILAQKTEEAIKGNTIVTPSEIREAYVEKEDKVDIEFAEIETEAIKKSMKISSSEVSAFLMDSKNLERANNWFKANRDDYDQEEQVSANHILIREKGAGGDAKKKAEELHTKLNASNFSTLANKHTEDPSGKGKGGALGWFGRGAMVPEFENVAFSLKPGSISKPVKTSFGWHIIQVLDKKDSKKAEFEKVKSDVARTLIKLDQGEKVRSKAREVAEKFVEAFNSGNGLKSLENSSSIKVKKAPALSSTGQLPSNLRSEMVLKEAFMDSSPLEKGAKIYEAAGGFLAVKVLKRTRPEQSVVVDLKNRKPDQWNKIKDELLRKKEQRIFEIWLDGQRKKSDVEKDENFLNS